MRILFAAATLIAISTSAGLIALQWWWPSGFDEPTDVLAENQRLYSEHESLVQETVLLSAENENLRERLTEQLIEGVGQGSVAL